MELRTESGKEKAAGSAKWEAWSVIAIFVAVFLSRVPWIGAGYGQDPDVYRVVTAARTLAKTGEYVASRLPGFPVHEFLVAFTPAKESALFSNGMTAVFSGIAAAFFYLILKRARVGPSLILSLAFAMTPAVFVSSTSTMDYMIAMAFLLASTHYSMGSRPAIAGVCLGLAIGARMTSGAMLLPLALLFMTDKSSPGSRRRTLQFALCSLVVGGACYIPVVSHYGPGFFSFHDNSTYPALKQLVSKGSSELWGGLGGIALLGLLAVVPFARAHVRQALESTDKRRMVFLSVLVVSLYVAAFLRLPHETAYLIPAVPFVLLSVGALLPVLPVRLFATLLILSPFVHVNSAGMSLPGRIVQDHETREESIRASARIMETVERLPEESIIVVGWRFPQIRQVLRTTVQGQHRYVYFIETQADYARFVDKGKRVYYADGINEYNLQMPGVDLKALGAIELEEFGQ